MIDEVVERVGLPNVLRDDSIVVFECLTFVKFYDDHVGVNGVHDSDPGRDLSWSFNYDDPLLVDKVVERVKMLSWLYDEC